MQARFFIPYPLQKPVNSGSSRINHTVDTQPGGFAL